MKDFDTFPHWHAAVYIGWPDIIIYTIANRTDKSQCHANVE